MTTKPHRLTWALLNIWWSKTCSAWSALKVGARRPKRYLVMSFVWPDDEVRRQTKMMLTLLVGWNLAMLRRWLGHWEAGESWITATAIREGDSHEPLFLPKNCEPHNNKTFLLIRTSMPFDVHIKLPEQWRVIKTVSLQKMLCCLSCSLLTRERETKENLEGGVYGGEAGHNKKD